MVRRSAMRSPRQVTHTQTRGMARNGIDDRRAAPELIFIGDRKHMHKRLPPRWPICPTLVRAWLRQLQKYPLEEWEVGPARGPWEIWEVGPARDPRDINQDPELALALATDGLPVWWPARHPETLQRLTREERRNWFVYWLTDELWARREQLRRG